LALWQDYLQGLDPKRHRVAGTVKTLTGVYSPALENERDIYVYLPPSYAPTARRYPVIYMHDGQNLFDRGASFAGEWEADEAMEALSEDGIEAILVGVANVGDARIREYQPFAHPYFGAGRGDAYLRFILETVKPIIDADFRTLTDRAHTGMIGSSLGGLITLYAFFRYSTHIGFIGALSPSLWIARTSLRSFIESAPAPPGRIYLDIGTAEYSLDSQRRWRYDALNDYRGMRDLLIEKGYGLNKSLMYVEDEGGMHNEADWARRLPNALRFLLEPLMKR
jgi:predicted alpha/beta superfamily hydrolase